MLEDMLTIGTVCAVCGALIVSVTVGIDFVSACAGLALGGIGVLLVAIAGVVWLFRRVKHKGRQNRA
jgi:hypothetical protein